MVSTCSLKPLRILLTPIPQEANWYTPEPGVPYRPNIAMPDQLKRKLMQEYSFFSSFLSCIAGFFAAVDPPHALRTEALLLPPLPPNDPKPAPVPSPTQDPGPGETPAHKRPVLVPAGVPTVEQPEPTIMLAPSPIMGNQFLGLIPMTIDQTMYHHRTKSLVQDIPIRAVILSRAMNPNKTAILARPTRVWNK